MPFTFVEIEEHKTRTLVLLFFFLVILYTLSVIALVWGVRLFLGLPIRLSLSHVLAMLGLVLGGTAIHWVVSTDQLVDRVLATVLAEPLDAEDTYHGRLKNIVEEVAVATGGRRIEPYVIPTPAMNACAIADFSGRCAIAVTEGLLARLNRDQLESVVGHEAAHIASGDSLSKSVFCGLFGLHEEGLKRLSGVFSSRTGADLLRGRGGVLVVFLLVVLWMTNKAKRLCELLISREQEYRADAVAVRLTRNPLSLAEALHLISKHWRGTGAEGESLSSIFIMDPGEESLSERDGLMADLFSTHPPTKRRINALLGMAHLTPDEFERDMTSQPLRPRQFVEPEPVEGTPARWFAWLDGAWKGPLTLEELSGLQALTPSSWIRREHDATAIPASQDPPVLQALQRRYGRTEPSEHGAANECPNCRIGLTRVLYEGVPLDQCPACRGCYVTPDQMSRIFAREDYAFPESIQRLAKSLPTVRSPTRVVRKFGSLPYNRAMMNRQCPKCGAAVVRKFYTDAYLVEVEQCWLCGLTWLDQNELELLQYLYEERPPEEAT